MRCRRPATWWAFSATASTTRRHCMPRTSASRWTTRWTWPRRRPISSCCATSWAWSVRASTKDDVPSPLKYIYLTTSANFGNMISMAVASFFLPFLPLLAKQILLNNFLSDIPAIGIAGDRVDADWSRTHRWDIGEVRRFMILFGLISSAFDLLTFGVLLYRGRATGAVSQRLVRRIADHRTRHHLRGTHAQAVLPQPAGALPAGQFTAHRAADRAAALRRWAAGSPCSRCTVLGAVLLITLLYAACSEWTKQRFFARLGASRQP